MSDRTPHFEGDAPTYGRPSRPEAAAPEARGAACSPAEPGEHRLCSLDELVDGGVRRFDVGDRELAVIRLGSTVYVIGDRCSHQDISLALGEVDPDELVLECPKHGSGFHLETGEPSSLPATRPVPVYDVVVSDGDVSVVIPEAQS
jgi:3-phenylpropionate/trans-cinnamate dioxygenase ferredoxin subunit